MSKRFRKYGSIAIVGATLLVSTLIASGQVSSNSCPVTVAPSPFSGSSLTTDCASSTSTGCTTKSGTVANGSTITLSPIGGNFQSTQLAVTMNISFAAVGDFNHDGWPDFVGAPGTASGAPLNVLQNQTWQNEGCADTTCAVRSPAPDWTTVITPKFVLAENLHGAASTYKGFFQFGAGDFNGDGWDDIAEFYAPCSGTPCTFSQLNMYLNAKTNSAAATGCPTGASAPSGGCATFNTMYDATTASTAAFKGSSIQEGDFATSTQVLDYDGDGHLDILIGTNESNGSIHILLGTCTNATPLVITNGIKKCSDNPTFTDGGYLIQNLRSNNVYAASGTNVGFGSGADAQVVFSYFDFDGDGMKDLIVGAPNDHVAATPARNGRIFKGCAASDVPSPGSCGPNKLETVASQYLPGTGSATNFPGAIDVILANDFTLDGKLDILVGTDDQGSAVGGGQSWLWKNTGTSAPFSGSGIYSTQVTYHGSGAGQATDFDVGFLFDYDQDPNHTADAFVADGNDSGNYYILANKVSNSYVACGTAYGTLAIDPNASGDAVVTGARITASFDASGPGESVSLYASNEEPVNWVGPLSHCTDAPTTDYCATFPKPVGKTIRWKAQLCGNGTNTPTLNSITEKYDYTTASEHYRAGVVVNDGVAYTGAFRQPGDRGKLYASNANLTGSPLWEAGAKLDAMTDGQRNIYTAVSGAQMAFTSANASTNTAFQTLLLGTSTTAPNVVTWARGARFGVGTTASPLTKLGSIITSSAAVLSAPGRPNWYIYAPVIEKSYVDIFVTNHSGTAQNTASYRVPLALVGSKDGMVHAFYTTPANQADTAHNGQEAWAYVPPTVAGGMQADMNAMITANATATDGENHPVSTAYPDGSPTLFDYYNGGTTKTVAMVSEGFGGRNFSVIDVTQTVDPVSGTVSGPLPMWNGGETTAGKAFAKPILSRVSISGTERFFAIVASGYDPNDATPSPATTAKGRIVTAYDVADGTVMWRFQAKCAVSSELTAFETDDALEAGAPTLDGYIDRVVFADSCGYVYKMNPAQDLAGGYINNTGFGTVSVGAAPDGASEFALFDTTTTTNAVGGARFIAGTIGARIDSSTRMILYFGTGGIESQNEALVNEFYAVYADDGSIRSKYTGTCASGICEKFYGGVVVTPTQLIFSRTVDASIATNTCDDGSSVIQAYEVNPSVSGSFISDFSVSQDSAVMGSLFAASGAVYFATLNGDLTEIGQSTSPTAGYDTTNATGQGTGTGQNGSNNGLLAGTAFTLLGWRTVL